MKKPALAKVFDLVDQDLETAARELLAGRRGEPVAEQALRAHDDQGLAPRSDHLAAQAMKELSRGGHVHDLHVALGTEE